MFELGNSPNNNNWLLGLILLKIKRRCESKFIRVSLFLTFTKTVSHEIDFLIRERSQFAHQKSEHK